jgi:hypothetical protein
MRKFWWMGVCAVLSACTSGGHHAQDGGTDESTAPESSSDAASAGDGDGHMPKPGDEHAVCERYIDCARVATPTGVTPLIATYGSEGSCWTLPGVTPADCAAECEAGRKVLQMSSPSAACGECAKDADCGGNLCVDFACVPAGTCTCPDGDPSCQIDNGQIDFGDTGCGDGLCPGEACGEGASACAEGTVCAAYKGGPKVCSIPCMDDEICSRIGLVCSPERDSQGRGLCVEFRCKEHADCASGACLPDGTCGCRGDTDCVNGGVCSH